MRARNSDFRFRFAFSSLPPRLAPAMEAPEHLPPNSPAKPPDRPRYSAERISPPAQQPFLVVPQDDTVGGRGRGGEDGSAGAMRREQRPKAFGSTRVSITRHSSSSRRNKPESLAVREREHCLTRRCSRESPACSKLPQKTRPIPAHDGNSKKSELSATSEHKKMGARLVRRESQSGRGRDLRREPFFSQSSSIWHSRATRDGERKCEKSGLRGQPSSEPARPWVSGGERNP